MKLKNISSILREKDARIEELELNCAILNDEVERLTNICHSYALQYGSAMDKSKVLEYAGHKASSKFAESLKEALNKVPTDYGRWEIGDVLHAIDNLGGFKYQERVDMIRDVKDLYKRVCADPHIKQYRGYTATKSYGYDAETQKIIVKEGEFWFDNPSFRGTQ